MRRFIRHPSDIPIAYSIAHGCESTQHLSDVSRGGLCFHSSTPVDQGSKIRIEIELENFPFSAEGTVAWCHKDNGDFAVGVSFNDESTEYGVRMVEQICHIEQYRSEVLKAQGREISSEEAAHEWIEKYAASFPPH